MLLRHYSLRPLAQSLQRQLGVTAVAWRNYNFTRWQLLTVSVTRGDAGRYRSLPAWIIFGRSRLLSVGGRRRAAPIGRQCAGGAGRLDIRLAGPRPNEQLPQQRSDEEDSEPSDRGGTRRELVTKITTGETDGQTSALSSKIVVALLLTSRTTSTAVHG